MRTSLLNWCNLVSTLILLLRISIFCHFGSNSFVLPIRPKDGILNRGISKDFSIEGAVVPGLFLCSK